MKFKILFISFLLAFGGMVHAQKSEKETDFAIAFNDYCASLTDSLYNYGAAWGDAFGTANKTRNFAILTPYTDRILSFIEKSQKELIKRKVNSDMEDLKIVVLDFLSFEKSMIQEGFRPFEKFNDKTSDETIKVQVDLLTKKAAQEEEVLNTVRLEQERLSDLYEFTLDDYTGE